MAESTVKILKSCIQKQVDQFGQDWDLYLHSTAFAIRSSINQSTNHTPAELILGDNLRRPIDVSLSDKSTQNFNQCQANEFATSLTEKIRRSADIVHENELSSLLGEFHLDFDTVTAAKLYGLSFQQFYEYYLLVLFLCFYYF